jgi:hypothetical protein
MIPTSQCRTKFHNLHVIYCCLVLLVITERSKANAGQVTDVDTDYVQVT